MAAANLPSEPASRPRLIGVSGRSITDELVQQVIDDLQERYDLDTEDLRALGTRLSGIDPTVRSGENVAFAKQFVAEHSATFNRLSR
jgi:hypothetical protein